MIIDEPTTWGRCMDDGKPPEVEPIKLFKASEVFKAAEIASRTVANPWARISDIARRLGVAPVEWGKGGTITALGADGQTYDLWEVIAALLDRMDRKSFAVRVEEGEKRVTHGGGGGGGGGCAGIGERGPTGPMGIQGDPGTPRSKAALESFEIGHRGPLACPTSND